MGRKRKISLSEMLVANGKVWDGNEIDFVHPKYESFGAANASEYENKLRSLDKIDLDKHATDICVLPRENREVLIEQLIKEFKSAAKS